MTKHFLDSLPIELLFLLTVVFMLLMLEAGYRFRLRAHSKSAKAQTHFENRMQYQIDEAVVAKKAFMQADIVEEPQRNRARELLMEYIDGRLVKSEDLMNSVLSMMDMQTYRIQAG